MPTLLEQGTEISSYATASYKYQAIRVSGQSVHGEATDGITLGEEKDGTVLEAAKEAIASDKLSAGEKQMLSGIPSNYDVVIWTEGYSIQNDLYAGAGLENLLDAEEALEHQQTLDAIVGWFAFEVEEYLADRPYKVSSHCNEVVPLGQTQMDENFRRSRGFHPPEEEIYRQIREAYQLQLRGKQLFQMLVRFLSASDRHIKHSIQGLYEIAFKMPDVHPLMRRLIDEIEQTIAEQKPASS